MLITSWNMPDDGAFQQTEEMALETTHNTERPPRALNIHQRMIAVMKEVREVRKTRENKHHNYKYSGHQDVTAVLRDSMVGHGILRVASVNKCARTGPQLALEIKVDYINADNPDDRITVFTCGESLGTPGKNNPEGRPDDQQVGKAFSYALKILDLKMFQLLGDETPDNEASHGVYQQQVAGYAAAPAAFDDIQQAYFRVRTQADLDAARRMVQAAIKSFNPQQYTLLQRLDADMQGRIQG